MTTNLPTLFCVCCGNALRDMAVSADAINAAVKAGTVRAYKTAGKIAHSACSWNGATLERVLPKNQETLKALGVNVDRNWRVKATGKGVRWVTAATAPAKAKATAPATTPDTVAKAAPAPAPSTGYPVAVKLLTAKLDNEATYSHRTRCREVSKGEPLTTWPYRGAASNRKPLPVDACASILPAIAHLNPFGSVDAPVHNPAPGEDRPKALPVDVGPAPAEHVDEVPPPVAAEPIEPTAPAPNPHRTAPGASVQLVDASTVRAMAKALDALTAAGVTDGAIRIGGLEVSL